MSCTWGPPPARFDRLSAALPKLANRRHAGVSSPLRGQTSPKFFYSPDGFIPKNPHMHGIAKKRQEHFLPPRRFNRKVNRHVRTCKNFLCSDAAVPHRLHVAVCFECERERLDRIFRRQGAGRPNARLALPRRG